MKKKIFYGWWIVIACFFISLYVGSFVFFGFTAFFEPLIKEFGWSYTQLSFAFSLRGLEMGIFSPLVGFLVDRFGPRKLILAGVVTVGLGLLMLSQVQTLGMFYGSYILLAFGAGGCTSVVLTVVVANWFKQNLGKAMGAMVSGFGASGLLVPLIVRLIDAYDWRIALIVMGIAMLVMGIPLSLMIRNSPEEYGLHPDGAPFSPSDTEKHDATIVNPIDFEDILKNYSFCYLNLIDFIRMLASTAVILHIMPYLGGVGISRTIAGLVAGAIPLTSIIGRTCFGWFGDVMEKRKVMATSYALMAAGMLCFCFVQTHWLIIPFLFFFSVGFGGSMVMRGVIMREYFGTRSLGKLLGITMGFASLGGIIGPTITGWSYDITGHYRFIWTTFFVIMVISVGLSMKIKPANTPAFPTKP